MECPRHHSALLQLNVSLRTLTWQREGHCTTPRTQHFTSLNHILSTLQPPASAFPLLCVKKFEAEDA